MVFSPCEQEDLTRRIPDGANKVINAGCAPLRGPCDSTIYTFPEVPQVDPSNLNLIISNNLCGFDGVLEQFVPRRLGEGSAITDTDWRVHRNLFGTVVSTANNGNKLLTASGASKYATMLRWEMNTNNRSGIINPNHVEWMMGFPKDFTKLHFPNDVEKAHAWSLLWKRQLQFLRQIKSEPIS